MLADQRRQALYSGVSTYRMVFSEADFLPGLIVDRYDRHLTVQILTQGMARVEDLLLNLLSQEFQPDSIILCNDTAARTLEGLPLERRVARGQLPDSLIIKLDGVTHHLTPLEGQKTGFYLDQRENRLRLAGYVRNKRVLDGCCYEGAWGLYAAGFGARLVVGVDQSARALNRGMVNARANGLEHVCRFEQRDIFEYLKESQEQFDLIVLDPPAFAKSKGKLKQAERGYLDLNRRAIKSLGPGGILVTCSCSHHLKLERFQLLLSQAGRLAGKRLRLLETRGQARDHPVLLSMPETAYLKCLFLEVLDLE
jgi:23S rRNA (cytosine1962-C5)-methyltransferase